MTKKGKKKKQAAAAAAAASTSQDDSSEQQALQQRQEEEEQKQEKKETSAKGLQKQQSPPQQQQQPQLQGAWASRQKAPQTSHQVPQVQQQTAQIPWQQPQQAQVPQTARAPRQQVPQSQLPQQQQQGAQGIQQPQQVPQTAWAPRQQVPQSQLPQQQQQGAQGIQQPQQVPQTAWAPRQQVPQSQLPQQQQQGAQGFQQSQQVPQTAWAQRQQVPQSQLPQQQQQGAQGFQQPQQVPQTAWAPRQQVPQSQLPQQQQQGAQGFQQPQQVPQTAWAPRQQVPQSQLPQQQQQGAQGIQQPQQVQQTAWAPRQQVPQSQLPQQQQQGAQGIQQPQQVPQTAWAPRQQVPQSQLPQQQQQGAQGFQQLQQVPQTAWAQRQQVPQSQLPQQQQQGAQGFQQPQQVPQTAWAQRQQVPQSQPPQQQPQTAWGPRQQASQSQSPQQPQQVPQTAWGSRQQVPQGQLPQQPQQVPQAAWSPRHQVSQSQPSQQQQGAQRQQKASIDIRGAGDHRQVPTGGSGIHQQQPSTSRSLDVSDLGMTDPFHSQMTEKSKMTSAQLTSYYNMIPKRTNPAKGGSVGVPVRVWTNMFKIIFDDKFVTNAVHYDIDIKPYKEKEDKKKANKKELNLPKPLCRSVFEQFRTKHFKNRFPAYDGKKNAYSANDLPIDDMADVFEHQNPEGRKNRYQIVIKKVANVDLSWIKNLRPGRLEERDQTSVQVLDIIMRHAPESRFTTIGKSLYWDINENEPLGGGLALGRGGFMSGVLGWSPYLNVDVSHKGFTMKQRVLDYIAEVLRVRENNITYNDVTRESKIQSFLRGLKVTYEIPNVSRRTHRIIKLSHNDCNSEFQQESSDGTISKTTTIKKYFWESKKYNIRRPDLPTLHVSTKSDGSEILLPIELCTIMPNQPIRKLDEEQTTNMIKKAATDAFTRKKRIEEAFNTIQVNKSPVMLREFHLSVRPEMEDVQARVLPAPELRYARGKAQVRRGTWNIQPFNEAKHLEKSTWTIVNMSGMSNLQHAMQEFATMLQTTAKEVGMIIEQPRAFDGSSFRLNELDKITRFFIDNKKLKLIIVIIPNRTDVMYGKVKKITEMDIGVLTQCMKLQTLKKLDQYKQVATVRNILLKINSKLNGVNHIFDRMPACLNEKYPCMLVGADVTHPSPDSKDSPSIAAVAASRDKSAFRYNVALRLQQPKEEMILDLEEIILTQLRVYHQETKCCPKRIVYYRDGVSEGQLPQVMYYEISAIKKAVTKFTRGANIEVNCLVVQKRHHVRLFPKSTNISDTEDTRNYNVKAGTIVDTTITHPEHIDFYLVSHASIQGTARPTKYRCIYNESNFTEDQIEELTYYLCHIYARCARAVSYPAPTYYAHLAAYRGRALIQGNKDFRLSDLEREQRNFIIRMGDSPMFFV
ncbi:protein argonaute-2 [Temnothorax nylanderi]|uniref:protein argonaute-2 n=1 Tax=Temnothorax nylanderi TaxID=102681 RepID=UPI003A85E41E